ncbi:uncharacterized protein [Rutidosis leptorrhynchoides]|uniref:uncharacterized protein n=1 Tax=Rutidosis leptorrhynchoides TaxID=125765 RepID=UPI003A996137
MANEEPYEHITELNEICATNQVNGFTDDEVCLRLFPYSLKDKAKRWFLSLPARSISTWAEMKKRFLEEFYPISKTSDMRIQIKSFRQLPGELFHEAYECLKEFLRSCPHHEIPKWELVKVFYDGLDSQNRQFLLAAIGGVFMTRSSEDEWAIFEQLSKGSKTQASVARQTHNPSHVKHVSNSGGSTRNLEKELDEIKMFLPMFNNPNQGGSVNFVQVQDVCSICGDASHYANGCKKGIPLGIEEQVNEVQGRKYDPYSNTYNPGWRSHPNFSWDNNNTMNAPNQHHNHYSNQNNNQYKRQNQNQNHNYQNQNLSQNNQLNQSSSTNARMESFMEEMKKTLEIQNKSITALGKQIGQVAEEKATRESDIIPSYTLLNPNHESQRRGHEVNMVGNLRNGKAYDNKVKIPRKSEIEYGPGKSPILHDLSNNVNEVPVNFGVGLNVEKPVVEKFEETNMETNSIPFPKALESPNQFPYGKKGPKIDDMWETFKQVKINIPLLDAIKQIPAYAKFLKDLRVQKWKLNASLPKKVKLTEKVSAVISGSLPPKFKDPGTPLISVTVGNVNVKKALLDLGASFNILPSSLVERYELGTLKQTDILIQLADRSFRTPRGMLENMIVKVEDFY